MSGSSFAQELQAALDILEDPVAVSNEDGTSVVTDSTGYSSDSLADESLEQFLDYARYGSEVKHGSYRHNRGFVVDKGKLFIIPK